MMPQKVCYKLFEMLRILLHLLTHWLLYSLFGLIVRSQFMTISLCPLAIPCPGHAHFLQSRPHAH